MDPADFSPADLDAAAQFLRQMLTHVDNTWGDDRTSFRFFRTHLTELQNEALVVVVPRVFRELTAPDASRSAEDVATNFLNLGVDLSEFSLGSRALNLELVIASYEAALSVYTREAFLADWAMTQNNLGLAYRNRIRGERAENLEQAISAYEAALTVYTRESFPVDWAMTQNNLGLAYQDRIRGERAENLERAITAYGAALAVYTRVAFPEQWAMTQNNLGLAYQDRIHGKRAENFERSLTAYGAALAVYTREAFPDKWAITQNNLGEAYRNRIRGEQAENLEQAISAYEAALKVFTRATFPEQWAETQGNLVAALVERFKLTEEAENLDAAIAGLESAVKLAVPGTDVYATNLTILGNALEYRHSLHSAVADLAQATAAYRRAATATPWPDRQRRYTENAADSEYALGVALSQQGQWYESLEHLDTSLGLYREVGSRLGRADALQQLGRTHYLMGNFDKARIYLRDALRLYQAEENLSGEAACRAGLGRLLLRLNFIDDAIAELDQACTQYRTLGDQARLEELQAVYTLAQKVKEKQPL